MKRIALAFLLLVTAARAAETPPGYAVATAHPVATAAGVEVLEAGGNAFDAAVAVSAALAVVEPWASGIGGGGFWLLHRASDGLQLVVDGRETAPSAATANMYLDARGVADPKLSQDGPLAAAIPGSPAAWVHLAQKYGTRPLPVLLAPAIRAARDGFAVDKGLAPLIARSVPRLSPAAAAVLAPQGQALTEGAVLRQPELAATLERLAQGGRAGFYQGVTADALVRAARDAGGIWTLEDLARYRVIERKPLGFQFRDYRIVSAPPPSAGGVALAQALGMLEVRGWPPVDGPPARHVVAEALRRAYRERGQLGDPAFVTLELNRMIARERVLALAQDINPAAATPIVAPPAQEEGAHTTHFSILDAQGNRVAATMSINVPFGSGFMAPATGVLFNNEMDDFSASPTASNSYGLVGSVANAIAPGKRPMSSMSPTFVEGPRGLLIVGTPGGSRIPSMVLLGVLAFIQGASAQDLVALPRYHHQHLPDQIEYEAGALAPDEQSRLNAMGHRLRLVPGGYGNMQAVFWDVPGDALSTGSDPRGVGTGAVKRTREAPTESRATRPAPAAAGSSAPGSR